MSLIPPSPSSLPPYQGYGTYSWPNGDVFMGEWITGVRHGVGILRGGDGREYVGGWEGNVREGYGVRSKPFMFFQMI